MQKILSDNLEQIKALCTKYEVRSMYAFGSIVSKTFTKQSDIDLLISFKESLSLDQYTDNYFSIHHDLNTLLNKKIDLITEKSLKNPYFIESLNSSKLLIYAA